MPLWEQVKVNLVEWYTVAADKTEELAKIGVRRYDKFGISRDIERQFTELGSFVYNAISEERVDFATDATLLAIVKRIKGLEQDLQEKEAEIEEIRVSHREKDATTASETSGPEGAKLDPSLGASATILPADQAESDETVARGEESEADQDTESDKSK